MRLVLTVNSAIFDLPSDLDLAGELLDGDHHELSGLERREADHDVDDAEIDVVLSGGLRVDLHEVRRLGGLAGKRPLAEQVVEECAGREPDLRPEWFVV